MSTNPADFYIDFTVCPSCWERPYVHAPDCPLKEAETSGQQRHLRELVDEYYRRTNAPQTDARAEETVSD